MNVKMPKDAKEEHKMAESIIKRPKISLKFSRFATLVFLILFTCGYPLYFVRFQILSGNTFDIIWGTVGLMYYYFLYTLSAHLYLDGVIKRKPAGVFWLAFFSAAIPLVHLIVPVGILKKSWYLPADISQNK